MYQCNKTVRHICFIQCHVQSKTGQTELERVRARGGAARKGKGILCARVPLDGTQHCEIPHYVLWEGGGAACVRTSGASSSSAAASARLSSRGARSVTEGLSAERVICGGTRAVSRFLGSGLSSSSRANGPLWCALW